MATEEPDSDSTESETTGQPKSESTFVAVADADELREQGRTLAGADGRALALFHHEGEFRAVDNRCPHMALSIHNILQFPPQGFQITIVINYNSINRIRFNFGDN